MLRFSPLFLAAAMAVLAPGRGGAHPADAPAESEQKPAAEAPAGDGPANQDPENQTPEPHSPENRPKAEPAPREESPPTEQPQHEEEKPAPQKPAPQKPDAKPAEDDNKPADDDGPKQPEAPEEPETKQKPAPPVRPTVEWNDQIEALLAKKHPQNLQDLRLIQKQVRQVVAFARPATVGVQVGGSVGSAVIVSEDGLVLTAGHVAMEPNKRVTFLFPDGRRAQGITLGINRAVDSGMMKITDKGPWPFVPIAPAGAAKPGEWVIGLGNPNGYVVDRAPPVRLGRILFGDKRTLCTDVTLVGGDSGGPLINLRGQLVGIHSRIGRKIVSNFHIPIDQYHMTWDRLAGGESWGGQLGAAEPSRHRPLLGVAGNSLTGRCVLTQVYPDMPAAKAGVKVGDVVRRFGDDDVPTFQDLARLVMARKAFSKVKLQLERDGEEVTVEVRLGRIPMGFPGTPEEMEE